MHEQGRCDDLPSTALDGLRGLAALSVVNLHFSRVFLATAYSGYAWFDHLLAVLARTPLALIWSGSQAVPLFFILSGFALHRMLADSSMPYTSYAARRTVRLWIPYIVVVCAAAAAIHVFGSHPIPGQSDWLNDLLGTRLTWRMLLQHVLMIGTFDTKRINPAIWSLVQEMRISLAFPLIVWSMRRTDWRILICASLALCAVGTLLEHHNHSTTVSLYATMVYQTYFVIGALIAAHEQRLRRLYARCPPLVAGAATLVSVILYCNLPHWSATFTTMTGATGLLLLALCSRTADRLLNDSIPQWLGRVSYSLYLVHLPILLCAINALHGILGYPAIAALALTASFAAAALLWRFVELPAIDLSRRVGRLLQRARPGDIERMAPTATRTPRPAPQPWE